MANSKLKIERDPKASFPVHEKTFKNNKEMLLNIKHDKVVVSEP